MNSYGFGESPPDLRHGVDVTSTLQYTSIDILALFHP